MKACLEKHPWVCNACAGSGFLWLNGNSEGGDYPEHLLEGVLISDMCDRLGLKPNQFHLAEMVRLESADRVSCLVPGFPQTSETRFWTS